jgi:hypothetical protein
MALPDTYSTSTPSFDGAGPAGYPAGQGYILLFFMIFMTLSLELARLSLVVLCPSSDNLRHMAV